MRIPPAAEHHTLNLWPSRSNLNDLAWAENPAQIHAVSLALDGDWMASPFILEGLPLEVRPQPAWGGWEPGPNHPPGWWRILSETGALRAYALRRGFHLKQGIPPGLLWVEVQQRKMPSLVAPEGVHGRGFLLVPDAPATWPSPEAMRQRAEELDRIGWQAFPPIDVSDADAIGEAFGGFFYPGELLLSWVAGLALSRRSIPVPGFPKRGHRLEARDAKSMRGNRA